MSDSERILSPSIGGNLRVALSISMFARLSVYCHHSSQDDRMTILEPMQQSKGTPWGFPRKLLIHYFLHCAPLKISTDSVVSDGGSDVDELILIWTLYRCGDYRAVIACVEDMRYQHDQSWMVMMMNVHSLIEESEYNKALELLIREETADKSRNYTSIQYGFRGLDELM